MSAPVGSRPQRRPYLFETRLRKYVRKAGSSLVHARSRGRESETLCGVTIDVWSWKETAWPSPGDELCHLCRGRIAGGGAS